MKRLLTIITAIALFVTTSGFDAFGQHRSKADKATRTEWLKEMRNYKKDFLVKELQLSQEQSEKFFPVYFAMEDEVQSIQRQTRQMTRDLEKKGSAATQLETDKTIEAVYELKSKEGAIELKYLPKFKAILSPQQVLKLKSSEQKFMRNLMKQHKKK